jgi:carbonic anhydrase
MRTYLLPSVLCCTLLFANGGAAQEHRSEHAWEYSGPRGPSHWGDLKPEYARCKDGHKQSPIDIRNPQKAELPPIEFEYKPSPLRLVNNGHTVMVQSAPGNFISVAGTEYSLLQVHFHRPSEEKIKGTGYDMVAHLVHSDATGRLAVVAILLEKGDTNGVVREIWNHLPKEKDKEQSFDEINVDFNGLLPPLRGYYRFDGSLTTPPCSEQVTWFVLKQTMSVSEAQIQQFSTLYPNNARPIQPSYDRLVLESR